MLTGKQHPANGVTNHTNPGLVRCLDRCVSVSYDGADGGASTQQTFDHLVAVIQRLHQLLLLFGSLADRHRN